MENQEWETITAPDGTEYTEDQLLLLVTEVKDFQLAHGSILKLVAYESESSVAGRTVGASLLPTPFPRKLFDEAVELQQLFHELYIRVAANPEWLHSILKPQIESDEFTRRLEIIIIEILDRVHWEKKEYFTITVTGYARFFNDVTDDCDEMSFGVWWNATRICASRFSLH